MMRTCPERRAKDAGRGLVGCGRKVNVDPSSRAAKIGWNAPQLLVYPHILVHQLDLVLLFLALSVLLILPARRYLRYKLHVVRVAPDKGGDVLLDGKGRVEGGEARDGRKRVRVEGVLRARKRQIRL